MDMAVKWQQVCILCRHEGLLLEKTRCREKCICGQVGIFNVLSVFLLCVPWNKRFLCAVGFLMSVFTRRENASETA